MKYRYKLKVGLCTIHIFQSISGVREAPVKYHMLSGGSNRLIVIDYFDYYLKMHFCLLFFSVIEFLKQIS